MHNYTRSHLECGTKLIPLRNTDRIAMLFPTVLPGACFSPRLFCVAVLGFIDLCVGRSVHALAALSVPVDVTHR